MKENKLIKPSFTTSFENLREHLKPIAHDKKDEWTGYGFLELPEDEKREAWAMYVRRGEPDGEEFGYFDRLIHGLMYPSESRLTKETNSLDELEDFWVNYCECQLKKMMSSRTFNLLGDMLYECVLRLDLEHFAFNLLKARKLLYNWAVESEKHTEF